MANDPTRDSSQNTDNYEHDYLFNAKQVVDVGSDKQTIVDESGAPATTYVGSGARGLAVGTTGWLLTKIVVAGSVTTITHAVDEWDNRSTTAVYS